MQKKNKEENRLKKKQEFKKRKKKQFEFGIKSNENRKKSKNL